MVEQPLEAAIDFDGVCWGYRKLFRSTVSRLCRAGYIGGNRPRVTRLFLEVMSCADRSRFDHVIKEFLEAFGEPTAWILDVPGIFEEVVRTGCAAAEIKLVHGIRFFRAFGSGGLGRSPEEVQRFLAWHGRLRSVDAELASALVNGYGPILDRLGGAEVDRYLEEALRVFRRDPTNGLRFLEGSLAASEETFRAIAREARLADMRPGMERLVRALSGTALRIEEVGSVHSDLLRARGSPWLLFADTLLVPERIRTYDERAANRDRYLLYAILAAAAYACRSFPLLHGRDGFASIADVAGPELLRQNLLASVEYARILAFSRRAWPGSGPRIAEALNEGRSHPGPSTRLFFDLALSEPEAGGPPFLAALRREAAAAPDLRSAARMIDAFLPAVRSAYPDCTESPMACIGMLPDFFFPAAAAGKHGRDTADQRAEGAERSVDADAPAVVSAGERPEDAVRREGERQARGDGDGLRSNRSSGRPDSGRRAAYLYDEWNVHEGLYHYGHCSVFERSVSVPEDAAVPGVGRAVDGMGRLFELLRPVDAERVKRLVDGDEINHDLLVDYLTRRATDPAPKVEFYERRVINRRDLCVLLLLDVSGSTGESDGASKVLEQEKRAAMMLAEGLTSIGDRFAVCGFSGNGREDCRFFVYKDFADAWDRRAVRRLLYAGAESSTRIGAALRHAGYRLSREHHRQRLIVLITDGRPTDRGYDPDSRYAQSDVRMACEENLRRGVDTFCISTLENSRADMETMFPRGRFVILPDMGRLSAVLPGLYVRLTT